MNIHVLSSAGSGKTEISAFDHALYNAGIANFNLITLSSVIPPKSEVDTHISVNLKKDHWGDKLYCVMARCFTSTFGEQAWAGMGWVQAKDGEGLFVEHHAESEVAVRKLIDNSLTDMVKYRPKDFSPIQQVVSGIECIDRPVCALVLATYHAEGWNGNSIEI